MLTSAADPEYIAPHCKKYEDYDRVMDAGASSKNIYFIRYADLILLYAECLLAENDLAGAKQQVIRVRNRAKVSTRLQPQIIQKCSTSFMRNACVNWGWKVGEEWT